MDGNGGAVFKFIPIDEVTAAPQDTNVQKLASTKSLLTTRTRTTDSTTFTEVNTGMPQILTRLGNDEQTTTVQMTAGTPIATTSETAFTNIVTNPAILTTRPIATFVTWLPSTTPEPTTTFEPITTTSTTITSPAPTTTISTTIAQTTTSVPTTVTSLSSVTTVEEERKYQEDIKLLQNFLQTERTAKNLNVFTSNNQIPVDSTTVRTTNIGTTKKSQETLLLEAILAANTKSPSTISIPNINGNLRINAQTTTSRSIEDDIRQFEEDTKLLKALLAATGQNPASLNIPSLDNLNIPTRPTAITPPIPPTTSTPPSPPTTTIKTTTTSRIQTTTISIDDEIKRIAEDAKLLQALLQVNGQNTGNTNVPIISGVTSNVRIASNPQTTSVASNPTTPVNVRPVYTSRTTTPPSSAFTNIPSPVLTTFQPQVPVTTEEIGITTTLRAKARRRLPTTTTRATTVATARRVPASRYTVTTEIPSTSTFSDEEDLAFLQNLVSFNDNNYLVLFYKTLVHLFNLSNEKYTYFKLIL